MADAQANIGINLDASAALAQLKNLQKQISALNAQIARGGDEAARSAANMQRNLVNSINATGQFSASMTTVKSTTDTFTNALEKNKLSMGEYFRYAGASSKKFSHLFTNEFNTIEKVARERVKTLQTQYVKLGRDANGALKSIAIRPLSLDMSNFATQTAMAAQKQQILNQLLRQGSTNLLNWGKNTQWAGRQLMVGFTIPLTIFGAAAASSFMKLEEQAIRFKRVYGELFTPPEETDRMLEDIQKLALEFTKYGVAVEKTMALAADAAAMGRTGADLTAQVTEANRLAVLGLVEQGQALETTTSLSNAFGIAAEDLASKIDFLNAVENQTVTSIEDMTIAIPKAGPVVKQLGGDVEDLAFFLTAMKEGGINASEGANALKSGLASLINPTQVAKDMLGGFGINITKIVESNAGNVSGIVVDFATALDKLDPLNRARAIEQLFGKFQFSRISTLFQNVIGEGTQAQRVLELSGATAKELAALSSSELGKLEASSLYKFQAALAEFQAALAPVGEAFLKLVTPIIEFGTKVLNAFNNLNDGAKAFVVGIIATLGAIGPVLIMSVGLLANGAANLLKIFLGLQTGFQRILGKTTEVGKQTEYMTQEQLEAAAVASSLNQSHATLAQTFTSESAAVDRLVASYRAMIAAQRSSLGLPVVASPVSAKAPKLNKGRGVPGYKDGVVMVPGTGNKDTELALLTPGEAVIPAKMASKYAPLINSMIADNIPGYMAGKTKKTSQSIDPVASHIRGESPGELSATVKELADAGYTIAAEVRNISESASGLSVEIDLVKGNLHELAQDTDNLFFSGETFAGSTILEPENRNAMYTAAESNKEIGGAGVFTGTASTYDQLQEQATILAQEQANTTEFYKKHQLAIDGLVSEANEARAVMDQSTDQERSKLQYSQEFSKTAIAQTLQAKQGLSQEEAEEQAGKMVQRAEEKYAQKIQEGFSKEEALQAATMDLRAARFEAAQNAKGKIEAVVAPKELGTDWPRAQAAAKGRPSGSQQQKRQQALIESGQLSAPIPLINRSFTKEDTDSGNLNPEKGISAKSLAAFAKQETLQFGKAIVEAMKEGLKTAFQSASPSKVTKQEMKNAVDGAVQGLREGQDDMQQAGSQLADAAETGVKSRRRGDPSRVQTAGNTTPGQPLNYSILNGQMMATAATTAQFRDRLATAGLKAGNFAEKTVGAANKIGGIGLAASSLVGGLSMVQGPLGEFSQKIFPIVSAMTALGFAMNMLNAEQVKQRIIEAGRRVVIAKEVAARLNNIKSMVVEGAVRNTAGISGILGSVGRTAGKLGTSLSVMGRAVGGLLGSLLGVSATVGLVVAGLALLAGGLYLLYKVTKDQEARIKGLGDAANISADRLKNLNEILGIQGFGARAASIEGAKSSISAGSTFEEQKEIVNTKAQFLELQKTNEEFKEEWKGTVAALKSGSDEIAKSTLEMLAVQLQTEGYSEEQIAGVVKALQELSGKTNVEIDFASININTQTGAIDAAASEFVNSLGTRIVGGGKGATGLNISEALTFDTAALDAFASTVASSVLNANAQFDSGLITLAEYEAQLEGIRLKFQEIYDSGTNGPAAAQEAVKAYIAELEASGIKGVTEATSGLVSTGTSGSLGAATTVAQAMTAGVDVSETDIATMETGFADGASDRALSNAQRLKDEYDDQTEAHKKLNAEIAKQAEITKKVEDLPETLSDETDAINQQSQAFKDSYNVAKNSTAIKNDLAVAEKIAGDETLRAGLLEAQKTDLVTGGTAAQEAFIRGIDSQISAEKELQGIKDLAALEQQIEQQKEQALIIEGLGLAVGDSALAQEMMNNAQYAGVISSALLKAGFDSATGGAQELATAMKDPGVLNAIALVKEAMDLSGSLKPPTGSGGSTPSSFLDGITKDLNNFVNSSVKISEGFDASLKSIQNFSKVSVASLRGLSGQLRDAGASESMIEKILGMDPKEWDKQKKKLFKFDNLGNITGLTKAGEEIQDALNVAEIGKFINEQENITVSVGHQITALTKLTDAGASYEAAYEAVKNTAFAAAIATATSSAQIQAAANAAMEAQKKMKEFEAINEEENRKKGIRDAIRDMNEEFSRQAKILDYINKNRSKLSEAQISAILTNDDLTKLVLEPSIDHRALTTALANAERQAELDIKIKKLTIEGTQEIFEEGFSQAMDAFGRQEQSIELKFKSVIANDEEVLRNAEEEIAKIQYQVDDYEAELERIAWKEEDINKTYDKRLEALDEVAATNERIARAQEAQLGLADALSQGDIAAAAKAAQAMRSQQAQDAIEAQKEQLEKSREAELAGVRSASGLGRGELEDKITALQRQIFEIEESSTEPAAERIRLAEVLRDSEIRSLEVLGKTREQWENIKSGIDMAQQSGYKFKEIMEEALSVVEQLMKSFPKDKPAPMVATPAPAPSGGGGGGGDQHPPKDQWKLANGDPLSSIVPPGQSWQQYYNENRHKLDSQLTPPAKKAYGGIIGRSRSGPPLQYLEGGKVVGPGTERSDSIPALLSNGEYVIQAPSVRKIGIDTLDMLNSGKMKPGYKDDLPAFKGGGIVKKQSTPVNIRQIERAAAKAAPAPAKPGALSAMKGTPSPKAPLLSAGKNQTAPTPLAQQPKLTPKAPAPPTFLQSFAPVASKVTAINIERTGQNLASWFGSTAVGETLANVIGGTGVGSTIARGAIAALSTPVEIIGGIALGAVRSINEKSLAPLITGATVGAGNAWNGVLDPSKMNDSMFTQAGKYVADNKMFGAVDAEGQARARNIGNLLNIVGDPLTYLGIGAATKVAKVATASRAANSTVLPAPKYRPFFRPSGNTVVSPEFIKGSSLTRQGWPPPKDVEYHMGLQHLVSDFANDVSGNRFFVKGHLIEDWLEGEPGTIRDAFSNEFLAGRIGNYIGANTPQSYIVQRSAGDRAIGSNRASNVAKPFEIATDVIPSSHNLGSEYMKKLVLNADNPYKALSEIFEGFVDYSKITPALNALMGNADLHAGNILWSDATKKFSQIDFNEANPSNLKMAPGIPGNHPHIRDAIVIAKTSMAVIRDAMRHSVDAALENNLLSQSQQLALISKMNASGFKLIANKNATDPLFDIIPDMTTTLDYTSVFKKIADFDGESQIPLALKGEREGIGGNRILDPWVLNRIKERADVLSEFGKIDFDIGDHPLAAQRMQMAKREKFMAGGYVNSINTDNIPAMLTAGEYVVKRSAVDKFGVNNLEKINNGTYNNGSMYNYSLNVNVKSDANPEQIASTVMRSIRQVEGRRIRGNNL